MMSLILRLVAPTESAHKILRRTNRKSYLALIGLLRIGRPQWPDWPFHPRLAAKSPGEGMCFLRDNTRLVGPKTSLLVMAKPIMQKPL